MGLSYGKDGAYGGDEVTVPGPPEGVTDEMLRRHFTAGLAAAAFGRPLLAGLLDPPPTMGVQRVPLPSRLTLGDVADLRAGTGQLRSLARRYGGQADIVDAVGAGPDGPAGGRFLTTTERYGTVSLCLTAHAGAHGT